MSEQKITGTVKLQVEKPWTTWRIIKVVLIILFIFLTICFIISSSNKSQSSSSSTSSNSSSSKTTETTPKKSAEIETKTETKSETPTPTEPAKTEEQAPAIVSKLTPESVKIEQSHETATETCYRYVSGRCYDDLEDEAAASGYYDRLNGDYEGHSFDYPDDCDAECQDILEEAYYDGYYDY